MKSYTSRMDKKFGISAELTGYLGKDVNYEKDVDGIHLNVHDGIIELSYDVATDEPRAKELAVAYINAYILRTDLKITEHFNHSWQKSQTGATNHSMQFASEVKMSSRLQGVSTHQKTQSAAARIVTQDAFDSASFANDSAMASKTLADITLKRALHYYAREVVDADRPLSGIYNAVEVITNHLGGDKVGRPKLAALARKNSSYVSDLMQATQATRHPDPNTVVRLSENECKDRAKILINAYAQSVTV